MRLIDADKLKADFIGKRYGVQAIEYVIDQQPPVDAVEVVRCKDCKWRGKLGCAVRIADERDIPEIIKPPQGMKYLSKKDDDFCSFGERILDETN